MKLIEVKTTKNSVVSLNVDNIVSIRSELGMNGQYCEINTVNNLTYNINERYEDVIEKLNKEGK